MSRFIVLFHYIQSSKQSDRGWEGGNSKEGYPNRDISWRGLQGTHDLHIILKNQSIYDNISN